MIDWEGLIKFVIACGSLIVIAITVAKTLKRKNNPGIKEITEDHEIRLVKIEENIPFIYESLKRIEEAMNNRRKKYKGD